MARRLQHVTLSVLDQQYTFLAMQAYAHQYFEHECVAAKELKTNLENSYPATNFQKIFRQLLCFNPIVLFVSFIWSPFGDILGPRMDLISPHAPYLKFLKDLLTYMTFEEMYRLVENLYFVTPVPEAVAVYAKLLEDSSSVLSIACDLLARKFTGLVYNIEFNYQRSST